MAIKTFKMRIGIKLILAIALSIIATIPAWSCTSLLVGKNASTDGSTMITYAADSHDTYGELYYYPAADHAKGAMREIRNWETNKHMGFIPEVSHTYGVTGYINENQVSIAESTYMGREELVDTTGLLDYGSLIFITLQRSRTAREAIKIMTDLVAEYGYNSGGESFSIADPNEIWVMDMIGKGPGEKGAVWVAIRIPDDCISGHANHSRIHQIPFGDKENCIYSKDVVSFARKKGYYKGEDRYFSFSRAYAITDFGALRGCEARVWAYYNKFVSGMDKYLPWVNGVEGAEIMPLYMKPDHKISARDMKWMMRDHFENTPFNMTSDIGAGPWDLPYRFRPMTFKVDGVEYTNERAIATQQTAFSFVSQMRGFMPNEVGGVIWFGVDDANTCVYIPMYCSMKEVPHSYEVGNGDLLKLSWDAAFWVNNFVANQAYGRYSLMIDDIRKTQSNIENDLEQNQQKIENTAIAMLSSDKAKAVKFLNDYSCEKAENATKIYRNLGEFLFVKYLDGNRKKEKDGLFERNADGHPVGPDFPGYNEEYYRSIVKDAGEHLKVVEPKQ